MALVLTEEQGALKRAARKFAQQKTPVTEMRRLRDSKDETGFDRGLWKEMADLGWAGILVPEDFGGAGLGYRELGVVFEELGRTLAQTPLLSTSLGVSALSLAGSDAQKKILESVATGETLLALAVDEGPQHAPAGIALRAEKAGSGYKLSGEKRFVFEGNAADQFVIAARTSGKPGDVSGITLFLVPSNVKGLRVIATHLVDSRRAADLKFENVEVAADAVIGKLDEGLPVLQRVLDAGRALLSAEMLGGAQEVFERTIGYLKERKQFDTVIGSFQALKHRAAYMFCEIELAKSVVADALSALDEGRPDAAQAASIAKAQLCETCELVTNEGIQLHGGIGMTDEHDVGLYMKRARVAQHAYGGEAFHRSRLGDLEGF